MGESANQDRPASSHIPRAHVKENTVKREAFAGKRTVIIGVGIGVGVGVEKGIGVGIGMAFGLEKGASIAPPSSKSF